MPDAMEWHEESRVRYAFRERQRDFVPLSRHLAEEAERASLEAARAARHTRQTPEHYVEDMTVTQREELAKEEEDDEHR